MTNISPDKTSSYDGGGDSSATRCCDLVELALLEARPSVMVGDFPWHLTHILMKKCRKKKIKTMQINRDPSVSKSKLWKAISEMQRRTKELAITGLLGRSSVICIINLGSLHVVAFNPASRVNIADTGTAIRVDISQSFMDLFSSHSNLASWRQVKFYKQEIWNGFLRYLQHYL